MGLENSSLNVCSIGSVQAGDADYMAFPSAQALGATAHDLRMRVWLELLVLQIDFS